VSVAVDIVQATKVFGNVTALDDVSISIPKGSLTILLGKAGAGKTTLLKAIAGLLQLDDGRILYDGQDVEALPSERRDIAFVFETYALYPHMSVQRNLAFPLRAPVRRSELKAGDVRERVREMASLLGIEELLARKPSQLSGGQRQRVALGRALIRRPRVFLLDEPISHLDAKLRHQLRADLKRMHRELGITTVYSTPDQAEALALGDNLVVLDHGRVEQSGTPMKVYSEPGNSVVAEMLGEPRMNIFPVSHSTASGSSELVSGGIRITVDDGQWKCGQRQMLAGVRAGRVEIYYEAREGTFEARVESVQPIGSSTLVTIASGDERMLRCKLAGTVQIPIGHVVHARIPEDSVYFFDMATGDTVPREDCLGVC